MSKLGRMRPTPRGEATCPRDRAASGDRLDPRAHSHPVLVPPHPSPCSSYPPSRRIHDGRRAAKISRSLCPGQRWRRWKPCASGVSNPCPSLAGPLAPRHPAITTETGHSHPNHPCVLTPVTALHIWVDLHHHPHEDGSCLERPGALFPGRGVTSAPPPPAAPSEGPGVPFKPALPQEAPC